MRLAEKTYTPAVYEEQSPMSAEKRLFARGLNFYKLFLLFFTASVAGYIIETLYAMVAYHKLDNRQGLIYGPFSPVYGIGAVVMLLILYRLRHKRDMLIFFAGAAAGGVFEFSASFLQETFLGTVSWDYTGDKFAIAGGRTGLVYLFFWGILGVGLIKFAYPLFSKLVEKIPRLQGVIISWILFALMLANIIISSAAVWRWSNRVDGVPASTPIETFLDENYPDERMQDVYRHMRFR